MDFDLEMFERLCSQCRGKVKYFQEVESTNDEARRDICEGKGVSGNIYIAEHQTKGRGRGGNRWICPAGGGLLFSLVLDPDVECEHWYKMSLAVGMAIVDVLDDMGLVAKLKWPNDIYVEDKKLAGILIENVDGFLIVGVGLNVSVDEFPEEVVNRATSLCQIIEEKVEREVLLSKIVSAIFENGSLISEGFGHLRERVMSCFYLKDHQVSMVVNVDKLEGSVIGLSEKGYLLLKNEDGLAEICQASDIKIISLR